MSIATSNPVSRRLTVMALTVLDIPFEPAVVTTGDVFDHLVEHVSLELSRAAVGCSTQDAPRATPYLAPTPDIRTHRRAKARARTALLAGRLPGSATSLRAAEDTLALLEEELADVRGAAPENARAHLTELGRVLARARNALRLYRHRRYRLARSLRDPTRERAELAARAARDERELVRALRTAAEVSVRPG